MCYFVVIIFFMCYFLVCFKMDDVPANSNIGVLVVLLNNLVRLYLL